MITLPQSPSPLHYTLTILHSKPLLWWTLEPWYHLFTKILPFNINSLHLNTPSTSHLLTVPSTTQPLLLNLYSNLPTCILKHTPFNSSLLATTQSFLEWTGYANTTLTWTGWMGLPHSPALPNTPSWHYLPLHLLLYLENCHLSSTPSRKPQSMLQIRPALTQNTQLQKPLQKPLQNPC